MKYWMLGLACVLYGVMVALLRHFDPPAARIALFAAYALPAIACMVTAASYGSRDLLRWAWLLFGAGYAIAFLSKWLIGDIAEIINLGFVHQAIWALFIVAFNVCGVTALALFARVWNGTGMAPAWRTRATIAFFLLSIVIVIPNAHRVIALLSPFRPVAFGGIASVAGDIISITLIGPIFATMIALRGGVLARPWLFLFASVLLWLLNNVPVVLPPSIATIYDGMVRPCAITFAAAAAIAQLWVKRDLRAELPD